MKKKTRVITVIDPAYKGDKSIMTTAAVKRDGTIHILNMEEVPSPVFTPKTIDWSERIEMFKNTLEKGELRFSRSAVDSLKDWPQTPYYPKAWVIKNSSKSRPPSTHKRVYKPGHKFRSMDSLAKWLDAGGWVFFKHYRRAFHPGWVRSFQFGYVLRNLGEVRKAVRI